MALTQRIKQGFLRLPLPEQVILVSGFLLMVSAFLPWYAQHNGLGVGSSVMGVEGPLFLIGILVSLLGTINFVYGFAPLMTAHFYEGPRHSSGVAMVSSGLALLLIGVGSSVFFHPQFGLALTSKQLGWGLIFALVSASVLGVMGLWTRKVRVMAPLQDHGQEAFTSAGESVARPMTPGFRSSEPVSFPAQDALEAHGDDFSVEVSAQESLHPDSNAMPAADAVDPLSLDPKTRYKLMQARLRAHNQAPSMGGNAVQRPAASQGPANATPAANFWGTGNRSAFGSSSSSTPLRYGAPHRDQF